MLSWETIVEVHALRKQGWSIAAIARHVGATRLTVRRYLSGERTPGQRVRTVADPFEEFAGYSDAGHWDGGHWDSEHWLAGHWDAGHWDAGHWDAGFWDSSTYD